MKMMLFAVVAVVIMAVGFLEPTLSSSCHKSTDREGVCTLMGLLR